MKNKLEEIDKPRFVIHEHHASHLHFDFRLEIAGLLKSWAVPKGVSLNPNDKRLAVEVPDHSLSYIDFEGVIAEGKYGAGEVFIWDKGNFETKDGGAAQLKNGKLTFTLFGEKLNGEFNLIKMQNRARQWLLIKSRDQFADLNWKLQTVIAPKI
jgi:bifunctional non-homologous end joining protein LigD